MQQQIARLQSQLRRTQYAMMLFALLSLAAVIFVLQKKKTATDIIRARGIIIEDSSGRDRILIGAPIPASAYRVRTDTALAKQAWAAKFGKHYMDWYRDYRHSANGMVVLNEQGFDKIAIGDHLPDPNTGRRQFEATGMTWNDDEGFEHGGLGVNKTADGKYRSVLGVDNEEGEAVHLVALEDGTKGLMINTAEGYLIVGSAKQNGAFLKSKESFTGIRYFNNQGQLLWKEGK